LKTEKNFYFSRKALCVFLKRPLNMSLFTFSNGKFYIYQKYDHIFYLALYFLINIPFTNFTLPSMHKPRSTAQKNSLKLLLPAKKPKICSAKLRISMPF